MNRLPGHPYVTYELGRDNIGQFWIVCHCSACNAEWRKQCSQPTRANGHILNFAIEHGHGLRPVRPR